MPFCEISRQVSLFLGVGAERGILQFSPIFRDCPRWGFLGPANCSPTQTQLAEPSLDLQCLSYSNSVTQNICWICNFLFILIRSPRISFGYVIFYFCPIPWEDVCVCNNFDCNGSSAKGLKALSNPPKLNVIKFSQCLF